MRVAVVAFPARRSFSPTLCSTTVIAAHLLLPGHHVPALACCRSAQRSFFPSVKEKVYWFTHFHVYTLSTSDCNLTPVNTNLDWHFFSGSVMRQVSSVAALTRLHRWQVTPKLEVFEKERHEMPLLERPRPPLRLGVMSRSPLFAHELEVGVVIQV
jgi:hypothetical protein